MNAIVTKHNLDFEAAPWEPLPSFPSCKNFRKFRIGTCEGLWTSTDTTFDILAIENNVKGNGHFEDVLQWFAYACKRDKKDFRVLELDNLNLKAHLILKRGFKPQGPDNVIKKFKDL